MSKFYKILWSMVILLLMVATVIFSLTILLVGAVGVSVYGIYRYYVSKKRLRKNPKKSYVSGEVIDLKPKS